MLSTAAIRASYRQGFAQRAEPVILRRFTGPGPSLSAPPPYADYQPILAVLRGGGESGQIGGLPNGRHAILLLAEDVERADMAPGPRKDDRILVGGRTLTIAESDDDTRRIAGILMAYEVQAEG